MSAPEAATLTGRLEIVGDGLRVVRGAVLVGPAGEMRRAITVLTFVLSVFTLAPPLARPAFAHGLGQSYDLPLLL